MFHFFTLYLLTLSLRHNGAQLPWDGDALLVDHRLTLLSRHLDTICNFCKKVKEMQKAINQFVLAFPQSVLSLDQKGVLREF